MAKKKIKLYRRSDSCSYYHYKPTKLSLNLPINTTIRTYTDDIEYVLTFPTKLVKTLMTDCLCQYVIIVTTAYMYMVYDIIMVA